MICFSFNVRNIYYFNYLLYHFVDPDLGIPQITCLGEEFAWESWGGGGGGGGGVGENYSLTLNAKGLTFNKKESSPSFSPLSLTSF